MPSILRAAACHVSPIFLNASKTTEKALSLINQAKKSSANLIVFPESFIPAFPCWSSLRSPSENHDLFRLMAKESLYIDGPEITAIRQAARDTTSMISLGLSEKARYSSATLFNSNVIIGSDGEILVHHRKLQPTFYEKLTWSPGDGFGLRVADTGWGRIGALVCGENTNPLARYSLMAEGKQVHISSWPGTAGGQEGGDSVSTTASADYDNIRANRTRAAAHCFEAKCFGIMCSGHVGSDAIELSSAGSRDPCLIAKALDASPRGATMFLDPTGAPLPAFTIDPDTGRKQSTEFLQKEEGILYADMNVEECIEGKQYHDLVGGYQRFDVFDLKVDRRTRLPVTFTGDKVEE
ncbi:carbon-nitrogen hydrolase [Delphinella strobiligena]|nr:carbon-nitrogen hydrolase [Delphinella strobiligena]